VAAFATFADLPSVDILKLISNFARVSGDAVSGYQYSVANLRGGRGRGEPAPPSPLGDGPTPSRHS